MPAPGESASAAADGDVPRHSIGTRPVCCPLDGAIHGAAVSVHDGVELLRVLRADLAHDDLENAEAPVHIRRRGRVSHERIADLTDWRGEAHRARGVLVEGSTSRVRGPRSDLTAALTPRGVR